MDKELIDAWLSRGLITIDQARVMKEELVERKKEQSSQKLIVGLSTIGVVVLGLGVILFVAANWKYLSADFKVLMLSIFGFGCLGLGYFLKFVNKNYPKVGASLMLLGSLIYSATIFLIAQIYHINAYNHQLILLCLVGILPLVYFLKSEAFAVFLMIGFYIWLGFFAFRSMEMNRSEMAFVGLPVLFIATSTMIFLIGGFHFLKIGFEKIGRIYRLSSINLLMIFMMVMTFGFFSGKIEAYQLNRVVMDAYSQLVATIVGVSVISFFLGVSYLVINPTKSSTVGIETLVIILALILGVVFVLNPRSTDIFTYLYNLIAIVILLFVFLIGYRRQDMTLVNVGIAYISIYIFIRYVDFFWEALDKSLFFIIAGVMLVGGGVFLERQRRILKLKFKIDND